MDHIPEEYLELALQRLKADREKFLENIELTEDGCWRWTKSLNNMEYGRTCLLGKVQSAHRVSYLLFKGPLKKGLHIDHLCRNRACVNPDHLELVTAAENNRRAIEARAHEPQATHCKHGHEFTPRNTYIGLNGVRFCRQCRSDRQKQKQEELRELRKTHPPTPRGAHWAAKTHCPAGHPYSGENLILATSKNGGTIRRCRACKAAHRKVSPRVSITHCPQGHEYTPENTYWTGPTKSGRRCRTCSKAGVERQRQKHRELNPPRSRGAGQASKMVCPQGHAYDEQNTGHTKAGHRYCRTCARERAQVKRKQE